MSYARQRYGSPSSRIPYPATSSDYGRWIAETWDWSVFATLTFRDVVAQRSRSQPTKTRRGRPLLPNIPGWTRLGVRGAEKQLRHWVHDELRPRAPGAFCWFAMESKRNGTSPHFHGLIGGIPDDLRRDELWRAWFERNGIARVEPIESAIAVPTYVAKYVLKDQGHGGKLYTFGLEDARRRTIVTE
jgi:hypothetical protein